MPDTCTPAPERTGPIIEAVVSWFDTNARDLPWREPNCSPWGVMVSEFMLQQTPVTRVLDPWRRWLDRWPTPEALALDPVGEAIREWGRLGYPRRALRLHAAATAIADFHDGHVPTELEALRSLPGVGEYTAAAIASFAFGQTHPVLDTNIRRVLSRAFQGVEFPPRSVTSAERQLARRLLPTDGADRWAAASMELGALVCTATSPACQECPIAADCAWRRAGQPAYAGPPRKGQAYAGTDRQVRGLLLQALRESAGPVLGHQLDLLWPDPIQRSRALASLLDDRLIVASNDGYVLPP